MENTQERNWFIFYRSFREAIQDLPKKNKLDLYEAITEYCFNQKEKNLTGFSKTIFWLIKPQLEANNRKWANWCKTKWSKQEAKEKQTKSKPQGKDKDKEKDKEKEQFEIFWNLYDKKIDKDKCYKKWLKLCEVDRVASIKHIPQYKLSQPDKKFRKNPETYINNKSWNNEIITWWLDYTDINNFHDMMMQDKTPELKQALWLDKYFEIKALRKQSPLYLSF